MSGNSHESATSLSTLQVGEMDRDGCLLLRRHKNCKIPSRHAGKVHAFRFGLREMRAAMTVAPRLSEVISKVTPSSFIRCCILDSQTRTSEESGELL